MRKVNWLIIGGAVVVAVITFILSLVDQSSVFYDLLKDINRALVVGVIVGGLTSLISNEILTVKKNNDKLRQLGIHSIGEGKLDKKQQELMFGSKKAGYPEELKFFLITGINFFRDFRLQMLEAMANGTVIKLLVADEKLSTDFLYRTAALAKKSQNKDVYHDHIKEVKKIIDKLNKEAKDLNYEGYIETRHYIDEHRYNIRLAKYYIKDNLEIRAWINFQSINKDAINQSLTVHGTYNNEFLKGSRSNVEKESQSIVISLDEAFDILWDKYK